MRKDLAGILVTEEQIATRVKELGEMISKDYEGKDLVVICVLRGSFIFMADLVREIKIPLSTDFISVSSYGSGTSSSGVVRFLKDLDEIITDRHVLIVEDIIDTGITLK